MKDEIEVELRGRLSEGQYQGILSWLEQEGEFVKTKERILLDYTTFLPDGGVRERSCDIRLRVTNGQPEIVTKIGSWGGDEHREEISVLCEQGSFDRLVKTYAVLGYRKAVLAIRHSKVFNFQGFEFAVVTVPGHSYYFEVEVILDDETGVAQKKQDMRELCEQHGLQLFDDEGFYNYIEELNREANEVFDFEEYTPGYFKERFNI